MSLGRLPVFRILPSEIIQQLRLISGKWKKAVIRFLEELRPAEPHRLPPDFPFSSSGQSSLYGQARKKKGRCFRYCRAI